VINAFHSQQRGTGGITGDETKKNIGCEFQRSYNATKGGYPPQGSTKRNNQSKKSHCKGAMEGKEGDKEEEDKGHTCSLLE